MSSSSTPITHPAALGEALVKLGAEFPNLVVLSPDVSRTTGAIKFKQAYPERFICTGISEMNTVGIAAGLSTMGWIPLVAGQAIFVGGKAWEPLRNSVVYPKLNVKLAATHAGTNVGADGVTHQAIEDIALMRSMPGMTVLAPTDANQVEAVVRAALETDGPVYLRLERAPIPTLTSPRQPFTIGQSVLIRSGDDVTIIGIGGLVSIALHGAELLAEDGISARVISMVSIKPLDEMTVIQAARETGALVVVEDHNRHGGLGGAVAETLIRTFPVPMEQVAMPDVYAESGPVDELRQKYRLTADDVVQAAQRAMARRKAFGTNRL